MISICRNILFSSRYIIPIKNFVPYRNFADAVTCSTDVETSYVLPSYVKLPPRTFQRKKQNYDYFLVLDFEATCDSPVTIQPQEIIEFPVLKVSGKSFEIESVFHSYVRPVTNPVLTKFCTQLTGITQEQIDNQPTFEDVFEKFHRWLEAENLLNGVKFTFASCGDWDLRFIFPSQCKSFRIPIPDYMKRWINIKATFTEIAQVRPRNMITMMKYCQLEHEGRLHSGLDDCKNIARVMNDLADRGIVFQCNGQSH